VQSGHHNGDIPVPLEAVERIEVLYGSGSSFFGADAFGGTVNIITRAARESPQVSVHAGSFESAGAAGGVGFLRGMVEQRFDGSFDRSGGFMYDRDFSTTLFRSRTGLGGNSSISVSALRKEFGANNFYGGNAPSREWTNQLLVDVQRHRAVAGPWVVGFDGSYRTHGDRFVFDQLNPERSDNRHRTHTALGRVVVSQETAHRLLAFGVEGGGDWIRSSNLGDHQLARASGFAQWREAFGPRLQVSGALRSDSYSEFGTSWSPSVEAGWWLAAPVRLRASVGRAFRVPTFTERYYSDPANVARADVGPEHSWSADGGLDVVVGAGVMVQGTVFRRADRHVIDWLRASPADRWQTYNIRSIDVTGVEVTARRNFSGGAFIVAAFTGQTLDAPEVSQLSKYALDYAPRSLALAGAMPLVAGVRVAPRLEYRRRMRSASGEEYVLADLRVSRRFGSLVDLRVDGTNLFDRAYSEVGGVPMPGAAMLVSVAVGR
jgi:iron complex outermembrane receptor protein